MATPLRSPYESLPDEPIPGTKYVLHDADTYVDPSTGARFRMSGFDANEMYNPAKKTPREVMAKEATDAAREYLARHGVKQNVVGRDATGTRMVDQDVGLADYMVRSLYAQPALGFDDQSPEFKKRIGDAATQANLTMLFDKNDPVANQWRNLPERDYANAPLPALPRRPVSNAQAILNAIPRGTDLMQSNLYGGAKVASRALQENFGLDTQGVQDWAQAGADRNLKEAEQAPQKFRSWDDVHGVSDFLGYTGERIAENLPQQIPMIAAGALAAAAAPEVAVGAGVTALGRLGSSIIGKKAATMSANALQKAGAGALGATAGNYVGQAGEVQNELGDSVPAAQILGAAAPRAALDTLSDMIGARLMLGATGANPVLNQDGTQWLEYVFDPMGQINALLHVADMLGNYSPDPAISPNTYNWIMQTELPALRGTLGNNMSPKLRAFMDWTMFGLNVMMLPLAVTSQFGDFAGVAVQSRSFQNLGRIPGDR